MSDDLQALIDRATPEPDHVPDFQALATRATRRRALGSTVTAGVAVIALGVGAVALWPSPDRMPAVDQAPSASDGELAPPVPAGGQETSATCPTDQPAEEFPRRDFVIHDGRLYQIAPQLDLIELDESDLGEKIGTINCDLPQVPETYEPPRVDAATLPEGTPIYAVRGADEDVLVATRLGDEVLIYGLQQDLVTAKAAWEANRVDDYRFDVAMGGMTGGKWRVTVADGLPVDAQRAYGVDEPYEVWDLDEAPTIDQLLLGATFALELGDTDSASITIDDSGVPVMGDFDANSADDEETAWFIIDFVPLPDSP